MSGFELGKAVKVVRKCADGTTYGLFQSDIGALTGIVKELHRQHEIYGPVWLIAVDDPKIPNYKPQIFIPETMLDLVQP